MGVNVCVGACVSVSVAPKWKMQMTSHVHQLAHPMRGVPQCVEQLQLSLAVAAVVAAAADVVVVVAVSIVC